MHRRDGLVGRIGLLLHDSLLIGFADRILLFPHLRFRDGALHLIALLACLRLSHIRDLVIALFAILGLIDWLAENNLLLTCGRLRHRLGDGIATLAGLL